MPDPVFVPVNTAFSIMKFSFQETEAREEKEEERQEFEWGRTEKRDLPSNINHMPNTLAHPPDRNPRLGIQTGFPVWIAMFGVGCEGDWIDLSSSVRRMVWEEERFRIFVWLRRGRVGG